MNFIDRIRKNHLSAAVSCSVLTTVFVGSSASAQVSDLARQFSVTSIDNDLGGNPLTSITFGPDGNLYTYTFSGDIFRYQIDQTTGLPTGNRELLFQSNDSNAVGLTFAPDATADNLEVYVSYQGGGSSGNNNGNLSGLSNIGRIVLPSVGSSTTAVRNDVITGLPFDGVDHTTNQLVFNPNNPNQLLFSVGSETSLGGVDNARPNNFETPLSAATLVADLSHEVFANGGTLNANTEEGFDPFASDAPLTVLASGVRNSFDLTFNSEGNLFLPINAARGTGPFTPDIPGEPGDTSVNSGVDGDRFVPEQLGIIEGSALQDVLQQFEDGTLSSDPTERPFFFGTPNPSRDEFRPFEANPTAGDDGPFEFPDLPVGITPDTRFNENGTFNIDLLQGDPSNPLIEGQPIPGQTSASPNGIAEFTANTELLDSLLIAFFRFGDTPSAIQTVQLAEDGLTVEAIAPLLNADGTGTLFLEGALDLIVDPLTGNIFVAGFQTSDFSGELFLLTPVAEVLPIPEPTSLALLGLAGLAVLNRRPQHGTR